MMRCVIALVSPSLALALAPFAPAAGPWPHTSVAAGRSTNDDNAGAILTSGAGRSSASLAAGLTDLEHFCGVANDTHTPSTSPLPLLSIFWLLRQIEPAFYRQAAAAKEKALLSHCNPPVEVATCNESILEDSSEVLEMWYFTSVGIRPTNLPYKRPGGEWLRCFARHLPRSGQPSEVRLQTYIMGMELLHIMRDDKALHRSTGRSARASGALLRSELYGDTEGSLLHGPELRALRRWAEEAVEEAHRYYTIERCRKEFVACGSFLTHRLMSISKLLAVTGSPPPGAAVLSEGSVHALEGDGDRTLVGATNRNIVAKRAEAILRGEIIRRLWSQHASKKHIGTSGELLGVASSAIFALRHALGAAETDPDVQTLRRILAEGTPPTTCMEAAVRFTASGGIRGRRGTAS